MADVEFELERTVHAPIERVFVRHHATMHAYGVYRLGMPLWRLVAVRERTATIDALKASFERS